MILLLGVIHQILMTHAFKIGSELSGYKLINYLIADHVLPKAFQEKKLGELVDQLLSDLPRRLCMDKRKKLSLRGNVRTGKSYYNEPNMRSLCKIAA